MPRDYLSYNQEGIDKARAGQYAAAIEAFTRAIGMRPDVAQLYANRAEAKVSNGQLDAACDDFDIALRKSSDDDSRYSVYKARGYHLTNAGRYDSAISDLTSAIRLKPGEHGSYTNRANAYFFAGQYEKAIADAEQALRLGASAQGTGLDELLKAAREKMAKKSQMDLAGEVYDCIAERRTGDILELLRGKPESVLASDPALYLGLSVAKEELGRTEEALVDIKTAVRLFPQFSMARSQLGSVESKLKHYREAMEAYKKAASLDSDNLYYLIQEARCSYYLGDYAACEKICGAVIAKDAAQSQAFYFRGRARLAQQKNHDALEDFNRAIAIEPSYRFARSERAVAKAAIGQVDVAIRELSALIDEKADDDFALESRAECYLLQREYIKALKDAERALAINSDRGKARRVQGRVHHELKNYDEALRSFNQAIKNDPRDVMALIWRAETHVECKAFAEAIQDYEQVARLDKASREQQDEARRQIRELRRKADEQVSSKKVSSDIDRLAAAIGKMDMVQLNREFQALERKVPQEDRGRFYEVRGDFYYDAAQCVSNPTQKESMQKKALADYRKAIDADPFLDKAATRIEELSKLSGPSVASAMPMFGRGSATPQLTAEQEAAVAKRIAEMRRGARG